MPIVCAVKNERNLLPHFLRHHRELGFQHFIFIDNDSNDGTTDYLLGQSDCVLYHTAESYRLTRGGINWISDLLNTHVRGDWGIFLDCDELLVYQDMETTSFSTYLHTYATEGVDSFYALMIDLYPDGPWSGISARSSSSLLADMNCFDKDYVIRGAPHRPWVTLHSDAIEVLGGPRCRLFSTLDRDLRRGWIHYGFAGQVDRFVDRVPLSLMSMLAAVWPRTQQAFFKTPVNLITEKFQYEYSHESTNHQKAAAMLGILHFKFCDELNARFDPIFSYHNFLQHGLERFQLARALRRWGRDTLIYSGTRRYKSSHDLSRYGLIGERPSVAWRQGARFFRTGQDVDVDADDRLVTEHEAHVTIGDLATPATHRGSSDLLLEQAIADLHTVEAERGDVEEE